MAFSIKISERARQALDAAATETGVDPSALIDGLVARHLRDVPHGQRPAGRAASRLRERLRQEASDDPGDLLVAANAIEEMKRSMNEERHRCGSEPIF